MPISPLSYSERKAKLNGKLVDKLVDKQRPSPCKRGYGRRWQHLRRWYLQQHPLCEHCERRGITTPAIEVDHIVPIVRGGNQFDPQNLQALCKQCHSKKTAHKDGGYGRRPG